MAKPSIESSPLALETFRALLADGRAVDAAKFVRDQGYSVNPSIVSLPLTSRLEHLRATKSQAAEWFRLTNLARLHEEAAGRAMLEELATPDAGPLAGLTRDEKIAAIASGKTGATGIGVFDALRRDIGEDAALSWPERADPAERAAVQDRWRREESERAAKTAAEREAGARRAHHMRLFRDTHATDHAMRRTQALESLSRRHAGHHDSPAYREESAKVSDTFAREWSELMTGETARYDAAEAERAARATSPQPVAPQVSTSAPPAVNLHAPYRGGIGQY